MPRKAIFLALVVGFALGCGPTGDEIPIEWNHAKKGMLRQEVEGLLGRKPDSVATTTVQNNSGDVLTWNSRTHILSVYVTKAGVVDQVSINRRE
jgi:hypothetical protein